MPERGKNDPVCTITQINRIPIIAWNHGGVIPLVSEIVDDHNSTEVAETISQFDSPMVFIDSLRARQDTKLITSGLKLFDNTPLHTAFISGDFISAKDLDSLDEVITAYQALMVVAGGAAASMGVNELYKRFSENDTYAQRLTRRQFLIRSAGFAGGVISLPLFSNLLLNESANAMNDCDSDAVRELLSKFPNISENLGAMTTRTALAAYKMGHLKTAYPDRHPLIVFGFSHLLGNYPRIAEKIANPDDLTESLTKIILEDMQHLANDERSPGKIHSLVFDMIAARICVYQRTDHNLVVQSTDTGKSVFVFPELFGNPQNINSNVLLMSKNEAIDYAGQIAAGIVG